MIAEVRPGWTMEYIDRLPFNEVVELFAIRRAIHKANAKD